jgi:ribosome-associated toxin RatA of RatAB toxin-antitoxin module
MRPDRANTMRRQRLRCLGGSSEKDQVPCPSSDCMKTIQKSVLLWHSPHEMFALVTDVPKYPKFLPWCDQGLVVERHGTGMVAQVGMSIGGLRQTFTTRNTHVQDRQVLLQLVDGPFSQLEGCWDFTPLGDGSQRACKIEFRLKYGFASQTLARVVGPVFDKIAGNLVDAFVKRADQVYGA